MAIKPWSWTASNGSASALQTQRAYNALITGNNTSLFSRTVWNDLVSKVYEVALVLGHGWDSTYATKSQTNINFLYGNLTAEKFNSLRQNTRYHSWSWAIDPSQKGYIGRTDFRGVSAYGEDAADTVYGRYFLELTDRLNLVIGIINGTAENLTETDTALALSLLPEIELTTANTGIALASSISHIGHSALVQTEQLPTWTLHIMVPSPQTSAFLESEEISSRTQAFVYMSCSLAGRVHRLPPVPLSAITDFGISNSGVMNAIQAYPITAREVEMGLGGIANPVRLRSQPFQGLFESQHIIVGKAVSTKAKPIGWNHIRVDLEIRDTLIAERKKELDAVCRSVLSYNHKLHQVPPRPINTSFEGGIFSASNIEMSDPLGLGVEHTIHSPVTDADLYLAQFMGGIEVKAILPSPRYSASLSTDHISTMLKSYLRMVQSGSGLLDKIHMGALVWEINIRVAVPAELYASFAPVMEKAISVQLDIGSTAVSDKAGILKHSAKVRTNISATAHNPQSNATSQEEHHRLDITDTLDKMSSDPTLARISMRSSTYGSFDISESLPTESEVVVIVPPTVLANMSSRQIKDILGLDSHAVDITGNMEVLSRITYAMSEQGYTLDSLADIGAVYYADLAAMLSIGVDIHGIVNTEGGDWQYPTYDGRDLTIYQVYFTEQNKAHLFLDPLATITRTEIKQAITATAERQIRVSMERDNNYLMSFSSNLQFINRSTWQSPILEEDDLYIRQALFYKQKDYILEVI